MDRTGPWALASELPPGRAPAGLSSASGSRRLPGRLGVALVVLLLIALAFELAARLAFPPPRYFHGLPHDPELGFRPPASSNLGNSDESGAFAFRLNRLGFRGPEPPSKPKAPGTTRLLFLGDALLQGWQVREEDLVPRSTAEALARAGGEVEAYGLSCEGYGTVQELLLLREHGANLAPDGIVLCFSVEDDLSDNSMALVGRTQVSHGAYLRPFLQRSGSASGAPRITWLHPLRAALRRRSRVFQLIEHRLLSSGRIEVRAGVSDRLLEPEERIAAGLLPYDHYELYRERTSGEEPDEHWERAWRDTELALEVLRDEARALGAPLLVALCPGSDAVHYSGRRAREDALVKARGDDPIATRVDWNAPEERLESLLGRLGIPSVSLLEPLRERTRATGRSMYRHDGPWNGRGHRLAAEEIARALVSLSEGETPAPAVRTSPVELPRETWEGRGEVEFTRELRPELLGQGVLAWRSDWWGSEAGWMVGKELDLLGPAGEGTLVVRGWLPDFAPLPLTLEVDGVRHVVETPGSFALSQPAAPVGESSTPYVRIELRADRTFEPWPGRAAAFVLQGVALEPAGDG